MHLRYVARSDVGLGRDGNEDAAVAGPHVLAVADGMGGHAAGEVASRATIGELAEPRTPNDADPLSLLASLFRAANQRIKELASNAPGRDGMGTTATVLLTCGAGLGRGQLALGHIGDSRAYRLRDGDLHQLTTDHTFVQTLVDDEQITPAEARVHPARSVVTKVLQGIDGAQPDLTLVGVRAGDRILVCSDGLTDAVTDDVISQTLSNAATVDAAADALIQASLDGGGPDNVTVVLADVVDLDPSPAGEPPGPMYLVGAAAPQGNLHGSR